MRRIHRKMLHVKEGGVIEGFATAFNEHFVDVTTDAFPATLKKVEVYIQDMTNNRNWRVKTRWQIVPTITQNDEDSKC